MHLFCILTKPSHPFCKAAIITAHNIPNEARPKCFYSTPPLMKANMLYTFFVPWSFQGTINLQRSPCASVVLSILPFTVYFPVTLQVQHITCPGQTPFSISQYGSTKDKYYSQSLSLPWTCFFL